MTVISLVQSNIVRARSSAYKEKISQKNKARRLLAIVLVACIVLALFIYIFQVNSLASKGYKINGLKKKVEQLEDENKNLRIEISNLKSVNALEAKTKDFNMVKAQDIEYVILPPASVVVVK